MARSDRPLARKLIRLGFQALGRSRAHRQDLWPGMRIDLASRDVFWQGKPLLRLAAPDDIMPRQADLLAVVGSGPSLKNQPVERLGNGTAILCNGTAVLADRIAPLAVAVEDERFVFRHHAMLASLAQDIPLFLSPAALRAWAERGPDALRGRRVALIDNLEKPVGSLRRAIDDPALRDVVVRGRDAALSVRPDQGVVITGTVAFSALQFALAAAPRRILLAGIDLANADQPRFYEGADQAPSGLTAGLERILAGFALARDIAARRDIALGCASPVSALLKVGYPYDTMLDL